jgi:predicted CoA-substrate-specific enzyme activase
MEGQMNEVTLKSRPESPVMCEGLEIGAVSVKRVRTGADGRVESCAIRHEGNPAKKMKEILNDITLSGQTRAVVTGQAAKLMFGLPYVPESECIEKVLTHYRLTPDILLSLGGETFTVYTLKKGRIKNIITSSKCAAGTGEFVVQQLQRMNMTLEEGIAESRAGSIVPLAARCSVYCKSDATHKLNKGECTRADIARSLIADLSQKVFKMLELARWPVKKILLSGGLTLNRPFVEMLGEQLPSSDLVILDESPCLEAFGAYLHALEHTGAPCTEAAAESFSRAIAFDTLEPLRDAERLLDYRVKSHEAMAVVENGRYVLGVDAGSTTTKAVLFNVADGSIGAGCYLRTHGNPVEATRNCLRELIRQVGETPVSIIQTAVTGSGRELVSVYLGNCLSFNEILAHARAASEEIHDVDTVFEIGGQDSKFISFVEGVPVDYAMNEGCSAGTGSFLEESVSVDMGIPVTRISDVAVSALHPMPFGERCAAFINTDLRNALQQGGQQEDVVAGLVYSIAMNYVSRIVGTRNVGERLLFQGGVALNRSVALALAAITRRRVVVPAHPELMGCVGNGLWVRDMLKDGDIKEVPSRLEDLLEGDMEVKGAFACKSCENRCEVKEIAIHGKTYPFGGLCSKYELSRRKKANLREGRDLIQERNRIMFREFGAEPVRNPKGTIGIPMVLSTFDYYPFYARLITGLGYNVVVSGPSKEGNRKTGGDICYPCEMTHGAVYDLMKQGVDYIFMPFVLDGENPGSFENSFFCPNTGIVPELISQALSGVFSDIKSKLLTPHISFSGPKITGTLNELGRMAETLGMKKKAGMAAGKKALDYFGIYKTRYQAFSRTMLENIIKEPTVIIAGKPYITCSSEANLALPRKITSRGYHVIPVDMLPERDLNGKTHPRNVWRSTQQITNALSYVKEHANLHLCMMSCFSCVPDGIMYHQFRETLAGETFCYLEIDAHTAHAGFETRIGAFLDIIEERRRKAKKHVDEGVSL